MAGPRREAEGPLSQEARQVLDFWFSPRMRPHWFRSTPELDDEVRRRFEGLWRAAGAGALGAWEESPEGALALVVVLDQFPLNMYRDRPESYAGEAAARRVAERAIARGHDRRVDPAGRGFFYLPFMHSEDPADQDRSVALYQAAGLAQSLPWAYHHRELIRRFGRFPHRNAALGRPSTPEELEYLAGEGAFRG